MGASRSATSAQSKAERPTASFGVKAPEEAATGYRLGSIGSTASNRPTTSYLSQGQASGDDFQRPESMVSEVRKAGSQLFNESLGINTEGEDENGIGTPKVSTSRMAGDIIQAMGDKITGEIDPTKIMEEEADPTKGYGVGAPTKTESRYTAQASNFG